MPSASGSGFPRGAACSCAMPLSASLSRAPCCCCPTSGSPRRWLLLRSLRPGDRLALRRRGGLALRAGSWCPAAATCPAALSPVSSGAGAWRGGESETLDSSAGTGAASGAMSSCPFAPSFALSASSSFALSFASPSAFAGESTRRGEERWRWDRLFDFDLLRSPSFFLLSPATFERLRSLGFLPPLCLAATGDLLRAFFLSASGLPPGDRRRPSPSFLSPPASLLPGDLLRDLLLRCRLWDRLRRPLRLLRLLGLRFFVPLFLEGERRFALFDLPRCAGLRPPRPPLDGERCWRRFLGGVLPRLPLRFRLPPPRRMPEWLRSRSRARSRRLLPLRLRRSARREGLLLRLPLPPLRRPPPACAPRLPPPRRLLFDTLRLFFLRRLPPPPGDESELSEEASRRAPALRRVFLSSLPCRVPESARRRLSLATAAPFETSGCLALAAAASLAPFCLATIIGALAVAASLSDDESSDAAATAAATAAALASAAATAAFISAIFAASEASATAAAASLSSRRLAMDSSSLLADEAIAPAVTVALPSPSAGRSIE
mmetsp:Transcript_48001/g.126632  ORF Transcript_48001/g.126632 Transcript_48001/m.126632 type:complete len:549 (+) Transcript_48001:2080-3726(+)